MIADLLLRSVLGNAQAPARVEFALTSAGVELKNSRQVVARAAWRFDTGKASTQIAFGPYAKPVRFDATPMLVGQEQLARFPMADTFELPAGMRFVREITLQITTADAD